MYIYVWIFLEINYLLTYSNQTNKSVIARQYVGSQDHSGESNNRTGVIGSDVPWLECPACNALTWVITVTE